MDILWSMNYTKFNMTADRPRKIPVAFYHTPAGTEVVRNWLRALNHGERNAIGQDLMRVQYRWPVGMPLCRPMGNGLWEVRSNLPGDRIARVLRRARSWSFTASSRSPRRRRMQIWRWLENESANSTIEVST
jgi:Phage derived protein Gp49-like (DUF891)